MSEATLVEAVLISGPRKGEIVKVEMEHGLAREDPTLSSEEMDLLVDALRNLDQAVVGLLGETKGLKEDLRSISVGGYTGV